jgi:ABC-type multidrug transport system permease subunit
LVSGLEEIQLLGFMVSRLPLSVITSLGAMSVSGLLKKTVRISHLLLLATVIPTPCTAGCLFSLVTT